MTSKTLAAERSAAHEAHVLSVRKARGANDRRSVVYGRCACGWTGPGRTEERTVRREWNAHVEMAEGPLLCKDCGAEIVDGGHFCPATTEGE